VIVFVALVVFTTTDPNARLVGLSDVAAIPDPLSPTVLEPPALVEIVRTPAVCVPIVAGVIVTATVQLAPAPSVPVRHVDDGSIAYGVPAVTVGVETVMLPVVSFVSVTVFSALVCPTTTLPKLIDVGETTVAFTPAPLNAAVSGLLPAFEVTVSVPAGCVPLEPGVSVTNIVQLELAASAPVVEHVPPLTA
jgi:hypothetical protein